MTSTSIIVMALILCFIATSATSLRMYELRGSRSTTNNSLQRHVAQKMFFVVNQRQYNQFDKNLMQEEILTFSRFYQRIFESDSL
jgi:hypothetical protein